MKVVFKILMMSCWLSLQPLAWAQPAPVTPPTAAPVTPPTAAPRPDPGMPGWARPGAPALGPQIDVEPEQDTASTPAGEVQPRAQARNLTMTLIDRVRGTISKSTLGGYGEFVFQKQDGQDSAFEARRFVLFLYTPILERISLASEIEYEGGGNPVKFNGQSGLGDVKLEFAVADVKLWDFLSLRAGVLLMPVGRLNVNHDAPSLDFTDRPLVNQVIIPTTWSEMGAGLTGRLNLSALTLSYELYVVNGLSSDIADGSGLRSARGSLIQDNNNDKGLTGRLAGYYYPARGRWVPQVEVGFSGYTGNYDRLGHRATLLAVDWLARNAYLELQGEYARALIDPGFNDDWALSPRTPVPAGMQGFYVELRGRVPLRLLVPRLGALPAWLGESSMMVGVRYEEVDTDLSVRNENDRRRLSFGLNLRLGTPFVWKHELQLTASDAGGQRREVFDSPALGYVSSVAFLF